MIDNIREIPYNYTSFSDKEVVIRLLGEATWDTLNCLRDDRGTGISARMLFDILGDMWVIKRNPYIQNDLLANNKRRHLLYQSFEKKLQAISKRTDGNSNAIHLIDAAKRSVDDFHQWLEYQTTRNQQILKQLKKVTHINNICFDGLSKVSHVTDASDWRVEYPRVVITPKNETEIQQVIHVCIKLNMNIVPRGGGTGYTGGAVPMTEETAVINTEKLDFIQPIIQQKIKGINQPVNTITMGAGTITKKISDIAKQHGLIFEVDPTSQDSSTIGGNIATNAGGKKAVMWGTTLDNLLSWKMVFADGNWLEITRENHNLGKIHDIKSAIFSVKRFNKDQIIDQQKLTLTAEEARKPGLGKDVTNKILGKLPGIQKEGCDGLITSATFVLHPEFKHTYTICLEFFNSDMRRSVSAITVLIDFIKTNPMVYLTGLEHLDSRYIKAVGYSSKSNKNKPPRMLLVADIASEDEIILNNTIKQALKKMADYQAEGFVAKLPKDRTEFWKDRSRTAAIASHTNAFKINEDVVIPLDKLADYSNQIEAINIKQSIENKLTIITAYQKILQNAVSELNTEQKLNQIHAERLNQLTLELGKIFTQWQTILKEFDTDKSILKSIQIGQKVISLRDSVQKKINEVLSGNRWDKLKQTLQKQHQNIRTNRIFIATHMHAGDGNIHTNIPVHSNNYEMLHQADLIVDNIMQIAQDLGGVISGEHGIGLTKIKYLHPENIQDFINYKQLVDKDNNFNQGKLTDPNALKNAYTPSLRLLEQEALILKESELGQLNNAIKDCLRCGKCKPVCTTHVPRANLLYSPRNKILATGLLTEAFLYEEQTKRGISSKHFDELNDIADHCTICHRCYNPCPVNIDFGDVTILIRKLLNHQNKRQFNFGSKIGMFFLNITDSRAINLTRTIMIRFGYKMQRIASKFIKPPKYLPNTISHQNKKAQVVQFLKNPMPKDIPAQSLRSALELEDTNAIPIIRNPKTCDETTETVFYFPGCGSERLFSQIGLGVLKWLYELNLQTIIPPQYLCCGYPQQANGESEKAHKMSVANRVLFHRIAHNLSHLNITKIVVSCGTCLDQLLTYELKQIFPNVELIDIHELLKEHQISINSNNNYLFHEPCHSPTKKYEGVQLSRDLLKTDVDLSDRCCGESGTFAVARPDIAAQVKFRKVEELKSTANKADTILTTCPACLQGLSRLENETGIKADYPILTMAKTKFGNDWADDFVREIKADGIELVLL